MDLLTYLLNRRQKLHVQISVKRDEVIANLCVTGEPHATASAGLCVCVFICRLTANSVSLYVITMLVQLRQRFVIILTVYSRNDQSLPCHNWYTCP